MTPRPTSPLFLQGYTLLLTIQMTLAMLGGAPLFLKDIFKEPLLQVECLVAFTLFLAFPEGQAECQIQNFDIC